MLSARLKTLGRLASRIIVGTGIYVAIVALATPLPAAAGLMLTFPALNGLAFLFSEDERATAMTKTMMWMPVVNGAICAGYIALFLLLAKTVAPELLGSALVLAGAASWYAWVTRKHVRAGLEASAQSRFAVATTLGGLALAAATMLALPHLGLSPQNAASAADPTDAGFIVAIARSKLKIALFASTLALFVAAIQYYPMSDSARGILAGLPIVPFGGLVSIAGDPSLTADARIQTFLGMIGGVWLGPPVAMWFILCVSRYLSARRPIHLPAADTLWRFSAIFFGWLVTFAVIVAIAYAMDALTADAMTAPSRM